MYGSELEFSPVLCVCMRTHVCARVYMCTCVCACASVRVCVCVCQWTDFETQFSMLIVSSWRLRKHFALTEVRAQSWYKVCSYELVNPTFKISLILKVGLTNPD